MHGKASEYNAKCVFVCCFLGCYGTLVITIPSPKWMLRVMCLSTWLGGSLSIYKSESAKSFNFSLN